jgi:hypothetical protein
MLVYDIQIGETYFWNVGKDVANTHPHINTTKVRVLEKLPDSDVATVQSCESGEKFQTGFTLLQKDPEIYIQLFKDAMDKPNNPRITTLTKDYVNNYNYGDVNEPLLVIRVLHYTDTTIVEYANKYGVIKNLHVSWFKDLNESKQEYINMYRSYVNNKFRNNFMNHMSKFFEKPLS